jgi:hypothetical protein
MGEPQHDDRVRAELLADRAAVPLLLRLSDADSVGGLGVVEAVVGAPDTVDTWG